MLNADMGTSSMIIMAARMSVQNATATEAPDCLDDLDDLAKGQDASRQVEREMLDAHHDVEPDGLRVDGSSCPCPTHTR